MEQKNEVWIFAYGSLIWNPEFQHDCQEIGMIKGYKRGFSMWSIHHRGTEGNPGLVLALDEQAGSSCHGVAFKMSKTHVARDLKLLRERELVSSAYKEIFVDVHLNSGKTCKAITYVVDQEHVQYVNDLTVKKQAEIISKATGGRGTNLEYLINTYNQLQELEINDPIMAEIVKLCCK